MAGEQAVGLGQLAALSLSGVPVLALLAGWGWLPTWSVLLLPMQGLLWGSVIGFGLVAWAYELAAVRRWCERMMAGVLALYFVIGGLAGEHTLPLLRSIPVVGDGFVECLWSLHWHHPFSLMQRLDAAADPDVWLGWLWTSGVGCVLAIAFLLRSASRLESHYVERHYCPRDAQARGRRGSIGDAPLSWWAVRRVREYAGRANLYLAAGAAFLYAAYLVLGPHWPTWLGTRVFQIFDQQGGVATMTTVLVLLASVPAAYQYGLWDSSKTDRCRRWEHLLPTSLEPVDYEQASWAASWARGRGYFYSAMVLWFAGAVSGRLTWMQVLMAMGSAWMLLLIYFVIGFRAFARRGDGTTVGFLLCVMLPTAVWGLSASGSESWARWLPPGLVYYSMVDSTWATPLGVSLMAALTCSVYVLSRTLRSFNQDIRRSFEADLLRA
jgi:hypothetical protein